MSELFSVGDRVKHVLDGLGTITKVVNDHQALVLFDAKPTFLYGRENEPAVSLIEFLTKGVVDDPQWETSYTKQVVDNLENGWRGVPGGDLCSNLPREEQAAVNLLRQYHRDLAEPYRQRDEARAQASGLEFQLAYMRARRDFWCAETSKMRKENSAAFARISELCQVIDQLQESFNTARKLAYEQREHLAAIKSCVNSDPSA